MSDPRIHPTTPPAEVMGLDLGTHCGVAWLRRGEILAADLHWTGRDGPGKDWHDFLTLLEGHRPTLVVFPAHRPARGGQGAAADRAATRAVLHGFLEFYAYKHGAEILSVAPATLHSYATGRGHADPSELEAEARRHLGLRDPTHHQALAAWALRFGLERAGRAQAMASLRHRPARMNGSARV